MAESGPERMGLPLVGLSSLRSSDRTVLTVRRTSRMARRNYRDDPCLRRATQMSGFNGG